MRLPILLVIACSLLLVATPGAIAPSNEERPYVCGTKVQWEPCNGHCEDDPSCERAMPILG